MKFNWIQKGKCTAREKSDTIKIHFYGGIFFEMIRFYFNNSSK